MSILQKIEAIIQKRNQQASNIENILKKWTNLEQALKQLEQERKKHLNADEKDSASRERLEKINFSTDIEQIRKGVNELKDIKNRLSRPTLNIGVVGRMRQGKSRLLRSLTGLDDTEIPTSSGGVCTRSLSKIFHVSNPELAVNEVEFHSSSSLQEIIHLYFDKLRLKGPKPIIPDDLETLNFPPPLPQELEDDVNAKYLSRRLRGDYYHRYNNYKSLIDAPIKKIPKEDIQRYTTQIKSSDGQINSEYLAVKELRIHCQFPYEDEVGKIGVIDLPGLGDDSILDVELLIKTLKQDVDFILFVRRPDPTGDDWQEADRHMYKIASDALGDFPISQCSFMVFNRIKLPEQDSLSACQSFQERMDLQEIHVCKSLIADCTKADEVKQEILTPVLENLTNNIGSIYEQYFHSCNRRLEALKDEINTKLEVAHDILEGHYQNIVKDFTDWFEDKLWKGLTSKIFQKRDELRAKSNEKESEFEQEVNRIVKVCREESFLREDIIRDFRNAYGDSHKIAYYMCINELKEKLTKQFKSLAKALEESERKLQLSIVEILSEDGEFNKLTSDKGIAFFNEVEKQIPRNTNRLKEAFQEMKKSTDTYEDTIIRWLQPHLNELNPDKHLDPISENQLLKNGVNSFESEKVEQLKNSLSNLTSEEASELESSISRLRPSLQESEPPTTGTNSISQLIAQISTFLIKTTGVPLPDELINKLSYVAIENIFFFMKELVKQPQAPSLDISSTIVPQAFGSEDESILKKIDSLREKVVDDCEQTLQKMLQFPNQEAYSKYDKFVTLAFKGETASREWRKFYDDEKNKSKLWSGAQEKEKNKRVEQEWQSLVAGAIKINQDNTMLLHKN
ncbi:MAG: dynamin family protein [Calothrix sp. C42_A2020_038]|nr:dynamin family protein [Calothrix sp. C42_A2020_038]